MLYPPARRLVTREWFLPGAGVPSSVHRRCAMRRHLVIIARDRPEIWLSWATFYGGAESVHLVLDRRHAPPHPRAAGHAERRTQSPNPAALQERGFLVIAERDTVHA